MGAEQHQVAAQGGIPSQGIEDQHKMVLLYIQGIHYFFEAILLWMIKMVLLSPFFNLFHSDLQTIAKVVK
jgi:hypothetical protein